MAGFLLDDDKPLRKKHGETRKASYKEWWGWTSKKGQESRAFPSSFLFVEGISKIHLSSFAFGPDSTIGIHLRPPRKLFGRWFPTFWLRNLPEITSLKVKLKMMVSPVHLGKFQGQIWIGESFGKTPRPINHGNPQINHGNPRSHQFYCKCYNYHIIWWPKTFIFPCVVGVVWWILLLGFHKKWLFREGETNWNLNHLVTRSPYRSPWWSVCFWKMFVGIFC